METIETDVAVMVFNSDFHWFDADPKAFARVQATVLANEVDFDPDADPWLLTRLPEPEPDRRQALASALSTSVGWLLRLALMGALAPCMAAAAIVAPLAGSVVARRHGRAERLQPAGPLHHAWLESPFLAGGAT